MFSNGAGKYLLDESSFPDKLSLTEPEFWQAYRNWFLIIDAITNLWVVASWKAHYSQMMADMTFTIWFHAWVGVFKI